MHCLFSIVLLVFALLSRCSLAIANDGVVSGVGGSWKMIDGEHAAVQMVCEDVHITASPGSTYTVDAEFLFRNHGAATTVTMGFPEEWGGDIDKEYYRNHSGFQDFTSWVTGRRVAVRRVWQKNWQALWIKRVHFGRRQKLRVRVQYAAEYGAVSGGESFANYHFTGKSWRGTVERSTLVVTCKVDALCYDTPRPKGNRFCYEWRNWQAENEFLFRLRRFPPGALVWPPFHRGGQLVVNDRRRRPRMRELPWDLDYLGGLEYNGVTYLALRHLIEVGSRSYYEQFVWHPAGRSVEATAGKRHLRFQVGSKTMWLDGAPVALPGAPFVMNSRGYGRLYVPLRPFIERSHSGYVVNARQRYYWFDENRMREYLKSPSGTPPQSLAMVAAAR